MSNSPGSPSSGAIQPDPSVIGGIAQPALAYLPDPETLFDKRAKRFADMAERSDLKPYLLFLGSIAAAQRDILSGLPAVEPVDAERLARSREHAMPPLDRGNFTSDTTFETTFDRLLAQAKALEMPEAARTALDSVIAADSVSRDQMVRNVLADALPVEALAEHVFVAAALQVHFARRATGLDSKKLVPVGDGACPCCGGPPVASLIVDWPQAPGARYCGCALCGTLWNYVRVRCTACGSTKGIGLEEVEGLDGGCKAETCEECHSYGKLFYLNKEPGAEPLADDVATLGLDLLMKDRPYRRAAFNPFLLGY
ncbi:protein FdhE [Azorhizobium oxalatiphilum]|uniref:Protein FdhE homolog n=1 Tax=Azorhizobium oxalatiphilum TaxID=980631 RepID=A0A917FJ38_9HYPH|nr:formate dehydrogenase accessory protein FdhE [Azorhizobium oxalatiphilum]GGF86923.1 protein FdhE [Azorhizobium oxalatiphilum]